jgi:LysR family glycine cleavage system transcriptional activator
MLNNVSLPALRAFEAASRLGSFRDAAGELGLSASAVSHAVLGLERALGVSLFERHQRAIRLTSDGSMLMRHTTAAFEELRIGLEQVASIRSGLLRLHCAPTFAIQVLSPRLPRFLAENPGLEVKIAASTEYARFSDGEFDADIVYGRPKEEGITILPIGEETIRPLCSPEVACGIKTASDLRSVALIRSDLKRVQWADWFDANDLDSVPKPHMSFDRSFMAIAAAANGLGVALESHWLAEPEMRSGRLVAPLQGLAKDISYEGHFLCHPKSGERRQLVRRLSEWLERELADH